MTDKYRKELLWLCELNGSEYALSQYWNGAYQTRFLRHIFRHGFDDFRSGNNIIARSFGVLSPGHISAGDLVPYNLLDRLQLRLFRRLFLSTTDLLIPQKIKPIQGELDLRFKTANLLLFELINTKYPNTVERIVERTLIGQPVDILPHRNGYVSSSVLFKILHYEWINSLCPGFKTVVEVGSGAGFLAYVLLKMNPALRVCLIDLPPQLGTAYYFLDHHFPGEVVPFSEWKSDLDQITFEGGEKRIFLVPASETHRLNVNFDLGIGTAAFQEMDLEAIGAYMAFFNTHINSWIYIYGGDGKKSHRGGEPFVDLVKLYSRGLADFRLRFQGGPFLNSPFAAGWFNNAYTPVWFERAGSTVASVRGD